MHFYGDLSETNVKMADASSQKALDLAPSLADAHAARGFALWTMNRLDEADREFETAIGMDPSHFDAHYLFARSCVQRGGLAKAARLLETASRIREDHEALYFTAQTYTAMDRPSEAKTAYLRAIRAIERHLELNPDDARAVTFGAVAWCRIGEPTTGVEWAQRAVAIDPSDAGIQYNVACLYALENRPDDAITCLENAVKAGFAHRDWVENDPDLDSLRDNARFKSLKWRE